MSPRIKTPNGRQPPPAPGANGPLTAVPPEYWDRLQALDPTRLCNLTLFTPIEAGQLMFRYLNEDILVDMTDRSLKRCGINGWQKTQDPLLELVTLVYLNSVDAAYALGRDIIGVKDLKAGHFFQGPHRLKLDPLIKRYGRDLQGFRQAAEGLAGQSRDMADAAYRLLPFPRVCLYFLLWEGDAQFEPRMRVLFDRCIEKLLAADAIWALVNRVSASLLDAAPPLRP